MIEIIKDGEILDLYPGTRITFNLISPLYVLDIGYNSHTFSFNLPGTSKNRRLLEYTDIIMKEGYERSFQVDIKVGGARIFRGYMEVSTANPITLDFQAAFLIDSASVAGQLKDTLLKDIDLGGTRSLTSATQPGGVWRISQDIVGGDAAIWINGFTYSTVWDVSDAEEDVLGELEALINSDSANNGCTASVSGTGPTSELTVEPTGTGPTATFFATTDIPENDQTFLLQSYTSSGEVTQDELVTLGDAMAVAAPGSYDFIFCPVKDENFYDGLNSEFLGYVNLFDTSAGSYAKNASATGESHQTSWVPFPNVAYLLQQALAHIGLTDVSTFTSSTDFLKLHLWNNVSLDEENIDDDDNPFGLDGMVNWSKPSWDLSDHVAPDMSAADLITAISRIFNLAVIIDVQSRSINFLERAGIISSTEKDWRDKMLVPYMLNYRETILWNYLHEKDDDDALFDGGSTFAEIRQDADGKSLTVDIAPLFEVTEADPINSYSWKTPYISQVGNTALFGVEPGNFSPRFFIFHGQQDNSNGDSYPMGSYTDTDVSGTSVCDYSLGWTGAKGLYAQYHQGWEEAQDADRTLSASLQLSLPDLLSIDWTAPHRIWVREGEKRCLLKQVSVEIGMTAISPAKVELVPL